MPMYVLAYKSDTLLALISLINLSTILTIPAVYRLLIIRQL